MNLIKMLNSFISEKFENLRNELIYNHLINRRLKLLFFYEKMAVF